MLARTDVGPLSGDGRIRRFRAPNPTVANVPSPVRKRADGTGLASTSTSESGAVIADNRTAYYEGWVSVRLSFDGTDIPPDSHSRRIVWFRLQHGSDLSLGFCRLSDELAQCRCRVSQKTCAERSFAVDKAANGPLVDAETSRESGGATE